jgi:hypothetical protein
MGAQDIRAETEAWVADQVGNVCFGEEYGFAVAWGPAPVQAPQGAVMIPVWQLVLTARNPIVTEPALYHLAVLGQPRPKEADVRREVNEGIRQLRDLARSKVTGLNGAKAAVPG